MPKSKVYVRDDHQNWIFGKPYPGNLIKSGIIDIRFRL